MDPKLAVDLIDELLHEFDVPVQGVEAHEYIESLIGTKLPNDVKVILSAARSLDKQVNIFAGFDAEDIESFEFHYRNRSNRKSISYFASHFSNEDFEPQDGLYPQYYEESNKSLHGYTIDQEIKSLRHLLPLFSLSTSTMLVNLGGEHPGEILMQHEDMTFSVFAPSIRSHLLDLKDGIISRRYPVSGDQEYSSVDFSDCWLDRQETKRRNLPFNEDGELVDWNET